MDVRKKLVELINKGVEIYSYGYQKKLSAASTVADHLIAHGVTVQERLVAKQVVISEKYGSIRCPSCNAILYGSAHYCWQCGQKVRQTMPQPPKGE